MWTLTMLVKDKRRLTAGVAHLSRWRLCVTLPDFLFLFVVVFQQSQLAGGVGVSKETE